MEHNGNRGNRMRGKNQGDSGTLESSINEHWGEKTKGGSGGKKGKSSRTRFGFDPAFKIEAEGRARGEGSLGAAGGNRGRWKEPDSPK